MTAKTSLVRSTSRPTSGPPGRANRSPRNLIIVVRADPIICGHSGEARHLAESAVDAGFEQIHLVTYPLDVLEQSSLPSNPSTAFARTGRRSPSSAPHPKVTTRCSTAASTWPSPAAWSNCSPATGAARS